MKIYEILERLNRKEWLLPPFQRDFVWNDMGKIIKFVDSLYRGYPIGSIIIWRPSEEEIKGRIIEASVKGEPWYPREYILDGQQRLTTIYRIFQGDSFVFKGEEFILHFDIENEKFCFVKKGEKIKKIVPFHEIINKSNEELIKELKLKTDKEKIRATSLFEKVRKIKERPLVVEPSPPLKREEALELFIRLNTGGRPLETENLALGYISIKWNDAREKLEEFRNKIQVTGFNFDFDFFIRCLSAISLGQSLKKKIVPKFGEKNVEKDWEKTKIGIERLIDFLKGELNLHSNRFIEAENTLIPLVLLFVNGKDIVGRERSLLAYAFVVSYLNRRYSGGKFRNLDRDIKLILEKDNPIEEWVKALEKDKETLTHFEPSDIIETPNRALKLPLFILLKERGVSRDLLGRNLIDSATAEENRPEFHHIFPKKWLRGTPFERERNHIANLTLITSISNKEINRQKPDYLHHIDDEIKEQHFIPKDKGLYKIAKYDEFIRRRQKLIAEALNKFLEEKRGNKETPSSMF